MTEGNQSSLNQHQANIETNQNVRSSVEIENAVLVSEQLPEFDAIQPATFKWGKTEGYIILSSY